MWISVPAWRFLEVWTQSRLTYFSRKVVLEVVFRIPEMAVVSVFLAIGTICESFLESNHVSLNVFL